MKTARFILATLPLLLIFPFVVAAGRLAESASPYLRQHANDPVDWHPWSEETLARARELNKPIFLSSGYSTCHWCHVMRRESFSDPTVAAFLNEHFIPVKLDREERPDIDRIYLAFVAATTGQGGWPLNVWLTPQLEPFLGGTYFPPEARDDLPAFLDVARAAARGWNEEREQVVAHAVRVAAALRQAASGGPVTDAVAASIGSASDAAFERLAAEFDPDHAGFGRREKFPDMARLNFLFRYATAPDTIPEKAVDARRIALASLGAVIEGGLHDVIDGGFHRYSVDRAWRTPHYEKMLYDQAFVVLALIEAYQLTGESRWADAVRSTLAFLQEKLSGPGGGFYAALDAESLPFAEAEAPVEGAYYTAEVSRLQAARTDASVRRSLAAERASRPKPDRDEKVIAAWNGYAISAFARAYQVLGDENHLAAAVRAGEFVRKNLFDESTGRVRRVAGQAVGFAEDQASLVQAALDLYEAGFDPRWLDWAVALQGAQDRFFWDNARGGYFNTATEDGSVLLKLKDDFDGAEPSANSISANNLRRLTVITGEAAYAERARGIFSAFAPKLVHSPVALPVLLGASLGASGKARQIVIAGDAAEADTRALLAVARRPFQPFTTFLLASGASGEWLARRQETLAAMLPVDGGATVYVCENFTCHAPVTDPEFLARQLASLRQP